MFFCSFYLTLIIAILFICEMRYRSKTMLSVKHFSLSTSFGR